MYLDELHHQVELRGRVHLLHQHDDVGVFDLPQHRDLVLDEVLLYTHTRPQNLVFLAVISPHNPVSFTFTFPAHLTLSMIFRANSFPVDLKRNGAAKVQRRPTHPSVRNWEHWK